jgi:hypothetical protein
MPVHVHRLIKILIPLFLTGLFSIGFQGVSTAQNVILYTPYTKVSVSPGESVTYTVDVINKSGEVGRLECRPDIGIAGRKEKLLLPVAGTSEDQQGHLPFYAAGQGTEPVAADGERIAAGHF